MKTANNYYISKPNKHRTNRAHLNRRLQGTTIDCYNSELLEVYAASHFRNECLTT